MLGDPGMTVSCRRPVFAPTPKGLEGGLPLGADVSRAKGAFGFDFLAPTDASRATAGLPALHPPARLASFPDLGSCGQHVAFRSFDRDLLLSSPMRPIAWGKLGQLSIPSYRRSCLLLNPSESRASSAMASWHGCLCYPRSGARRHRAACTARPATPGGRSSDPRLGAPCTLSSRKLHDPMQQLYIPCFLLHTIQQAGNAIPFARGNGWAGRCCRSRRNPRPISLVAARALAPRARACCSAHADWPHRTSAISSALPLRDAARHSHEHHRPKTDSVWEPIFRVEARVSRCSRSHPISTHVSLAGCIGRRSSRAFAPCASPSLPLGWR